MMSRIAYSEISVTTPAPTVRPPSRIANRSSFSIAIGMISSLAIVTLAPLLLRQHVALRLELPVRLDRPRLGEHLPPLYLLLVDPPQQTAHVVPRLPPAHEPPQA